MWTNIPKFLNKFVRSANNHLHTHNCNCIPTMWANLHDPSLNSFDSLGIPHIVGRFPSWTKRISFCDRKVDAKHLPDFEFPILSTALSMSAPFDVMNWGIWGQRCGLYGYRLLLCEGSTVNLQMNFRSAVSAGILKISGSWFFCFLTRSAMYRVTFAVKLIDGIFFAASGSIKNTSGCSRLPNLFNFSQSYLI